MARIFIVDDDQLTRVALGGIIRLNPSHTLVGHAWNGELALQAIRGSMPDLVCLDIMMPVLDGLAVLRRIRDEHPAMRVVIITAAATPDVMEEARAQGAHGFLLKPLSARSVLSTIDAALRSEETLRPNQH
jgi:DNA-binding NarL/FixJ family response regulator